MEDKILKKIQNDLKSTKNPVVINNNDNLNEYAYNNFEEAIEVKGKTRTGDEGEKKGTINNGNYYNFQFIEILLKIFKVNIPESGRALIDDDSRSSGDSGNSESRVLDIKNYFN